MTLTYYVQPLLGSLGNARECLEEGGVRGVDGMTQHEELL